MEEEVFQRHFWLFSRHLETTAAIFSKSPAVLYQRQVMRNFDDEDVIIDFSLGSKNKPLLVIFHGLEGCSQSGTVRRIASGFIRRQWSVAVPHFRSCGGVQNISPRAYHAADTADLEWLLQHCANTFPHSALFAAGVSLGGNMLINSLSAANSAKLNAAATVSVPFDLNACVRVIDSGLNRLLYTRYFLRSLLHKTMKKSAHYPDLCDWEKLRRATTLASFDAIYTAPVHGFKNAEEYWRSGSCGNSIRRVRTPLICINALNDPLVPAQTLPQAASPTVLFCRPQHGGHGSFIGKPQQWLSDTLASFFLCHHKT